MDTRQIQHQPPAEIAELLAAWNTHEDLRASGATIAELAASRQTLDAIRFELHSSVALAS